MDDIVLTSGRTLSATSGIVGIDHRGWVSEGADAPLVNDLYQWPWEWSVADRKELADIMITQWQRFGDGSLMEREENVF